MLLIAYSTTVCERNLLLTYQAAGKNPMPKQTAPAPNLENHFGITAVRDSIHVERRSHARVWLNA